MKRASEWLWCPALEKSERFLTGWKAYVRVAPNVRLDFPTDRLVFHRAELIIDLR